jgi:uridine kinase
MDRMSMSPTSRPVVIGVAGGSGSGKTTVVRRIVHSVGGTGVGENQNAFDVRRGSVSVRKTLRAGQPVEVPVYDFARYQREPAGSDGCQSICRLHRSSLVLTK